MTDEPPPSSVAAVCPAQMNLVSVCRIPVARTFVWKEKTCRDGGREGQVNFISEGKFPTRTCVWNWITYPKSAFFLFLPKNSCSATTKYIVCSVSDVFHSLFHRSVYFLII